MLKIMFWVLGAAAVLCITCAAIGAHISAEKPSERIERACTQQYPLDPKGEQRCELNLLIGAVEADQSDPAHMARAKAAAGD